MATAADWSEDELQLMLRNGMEMPTRTGGLCGKLTSLRDDGFVVLDLGWGVATLPRCELVPPPRYAPGTRVSTQFGRGVVLELRKVGGGVGYAVTLVDCGPGTVGYLGAMSCSRRDPTDLTFDEMLADAEGLRKRGNDAFMAKDFDRAVEEYSRVVSVFQHVRSALTLQQRSAMREAVVKAWSNAGQACINKGDAASLKDAVHHTSEALEVDPLDETKQREKLLYRRAMAQFGLNNFDAAEKDLRSPALAASPEAAAKLREVLALQRKAESANRKFWSSAVAKSADAKDAEAAAGSSVRFAATPSKPGDADASSPRSPKRSAGAARVTPHPAKRGAGAAAAGGGSEVEDVVPASTGPSPSKGSGRTPLRALRPAQGSLTVEEEAGDAEEGPSTVWPYVLGFAAVAAVATAVGIAVLRSRSGR